MGVHSFLPVSKRGGKSAGHSFFPVLIRFGKAKLFTKIIYTPKIYLLYGMYAYGNVIS